MQGTSRQNQAFSPDRPAVFLDTADANVLPNVWPVTPQEYVHSVEMFDPSHAPLNLSDVGLTSSKQFYPSASINDASLPPLDDVGHSQPIQSVYSRDARSINDQLDAHPSFNYLHYGVDGSHNTNAPEQLPSEISLAKPGTSGSTMGVPKHDKDTLKRIVGNGRVNPDDSPAPKMQKRGASVIAQTPPPIGAQPRLRRVMVQPQRTIIAKPSQTLDRVAIQPATNIQASEETASRNFSQGSLSRTFDEVARANGRSTR
ncbi:hypothetical protein SAMN03159288_04604 [Rhizobium sp. NFACC06-2]|nr:hypothetical protein SAMN03159288_04604 [Rhizobium sp. NFACC06-2]